MASAPPSAGVEKALFSSPTPVMAAPQRPLATANPPAAPQTSSAPMLASSNAASPPPALSAECTAAVGSVISDDLRQLSRDDLDVKRWLNTTLSRVLEAAKGASGPLTETNKAAAAPSLAARKTLQLEEQLVQLLHARVQTHSQELSAGIEDVISNTLVRLPRTTMELARMSTEAEELTGQLQSIEQVVQPAANVPSTGYVAQLHRKKASETKLRTCTRLLEKAARVEESIRNIQYLVEHREAKNKGESAKSSDAAQNPPASVNNNNNNYNSSGGGSASTATRQRDLDEVAGIIRQAREDLKDITAVDDTFGEQYKAQLEQFEQYIEHALEEECVACLRAHQLERATRLITTLHRIGRADAVLKRYGEQAASQMVEQQEARLRAAVEAAGSTGGADGTRKPSPATSSSAAAAVAELLAREIIPDDNAFLSQELVFLASLVRGAAPDAAATAASSASHVGDVSGSAEASLAGTPARGTTTAAGTATSSVSPHGKAASHAGQTVEDDPRAAQVLEVLAVLLSKLHDPVQAILKPLLTERPDTTNADCVACFAAIQQLKITVTGAGAGSGSGGAVEGRAQANATTGAVAAGPATAKDPLEKLAREVTHRALALFASLFQEAAVVERYADRVCTPVHAFCAQPLAKLLPPSAAASSVGDGDEETLSHLLTQAALEVLVYVPDKISARCTAAWHAELSAAFVAQLQPTPTTSQHALLQRLYLYRQRVKPLLVKTQQVVEDWLSSGAMHARYPTSAGLLRADLLTRLWTPLRAEAEAAQKATEEAVLRGITGPIVAKVGAYTTLPCWGNSSGPSHTANGEATGAGTPSPSVAPAKPMELYAQSQAAPSGAVRDLGEMLMELPLTLETLASTAVAESYAGAQPSQVTVVAAADTEAEEGVRLLIDEQAEDWLESVVHDVVKTFLDEKVLPLQVGPFAGSNADQLTQLYAVALEQLTTDLDYLRNILSAVNEESQETVERVMSALQALAATSQAAFVVGDKIHMRSSDAKSGGDDDGGAGNAAEAGHKHEAS